MPLSCIVWPMEYRFVSLLLEDMMPEYENEELTINPTQVFSVHNLTLKPNQPEEPPFTNHMKAIYNLDVPVDSKSPKPSSNVKSSAMDLNPSQPLVSTLVDTGLHKEDQQATGGPTSLGVTSEARANPQLSSGSNLSVLVDKTTFARDGLKTAHADSGANEESRADDISLKVKLEDLLDMLKDTRSAFFTPDSPPDEPIIILDESKEEELQKIKTLKQLFMIILHKVTDTLNKFATMVENASRAISMNVPSSGKATASHVEGEKNTKDTETNLQKKLIDLLGIKVNGERWYKLVLIEEKKDGKPSMD
ncbi:hypothetical protein Tco_0033665 [Tanacetum coccineum]